MWTRIVSIEPTCASTRVLNDLGITLFPLNFSYGEIDTKLGINPHNCLKLSSKSLKNCFFKSLKLFLKSPKLSLKSFYLSSKSLELSLKSLTLSLKSLKLSLKSLKPSSTVVK